MGIGELIQFMLLTGFVGGGIGGLAEVFIQLQKTIGAVDRVLELIDSKGEEFDLEAETYKLKESLVFEDVNFTYPSRNDVEVLQNINLDIQKGQTIAIVGHSGSGKSTLAAVIAGKEEFEVTKGNVVLDGEDLEDDG